MINFPRHTLQDISMGGGVSIGGAYSSSSTISGLRRTVEKREKTIQDLKDEIVEYKKQITELTDIKKVYI